MNNRNRAEELSKSGYVEIAFREKLTDTEYAYVASTPELKGCVVQGDTIIEARENLKQFRVDYIEHLLDHGLPVPEPASPSKPVELRRVVSSSDFVQREADPLEQESDTNHPTVTLMNEDKVVAYG